MTLIVVGSDYFCRKKDIEIGIYACTVDLLD